MECNNLKRLSIVTPVFNEEDNVELFYNTVKRELDKVQLRCDYEIIFTDNCSTVQTFEKLSSLAEKDERVKVFRFSRNFGHQKSLLTGCCLASGDCAIQLDCDLQDPPEMIHDFLKEWEKGAEVVFGIRKARDESLLYQWVRKSFYRVIDFLSEDRLPHDAGDFRLVDRKVLNQLRNLYDASPYLRGSISSFGFKQVGIPYQRMKRIHGRGKYNLKSCLSLAMDGILNHSLVPLRLATLTGFIISSGLIVYFLCIASLNMFFDIEWPRGFATTTVLILVSISLNALFLGVIGEYIGRMYRQIKRVPMTIIDKTLNVDGHLDL